MIIGNARKAVNYTAKDYIQNGLAAMWDGIENAGWGVHSDEIRVCKDLIGDNGGFYYIIPYSDHIMFEPVDNWVDRNLGVAVNNAFSSNNFALEIVCKIKYNFDIYNDEDIWQGRTRNGGTEWMTSIGIRDYNRTVIFQYYNNNTIYDITFRNKIASTTISKANSNPRIYYNGNYMDSLQDNETHIYGTRSLFYSNVGYYSVRIYNRALSEAEIKHNYMIDKWRFGL